MEIRALTGFDKSTREQYGRSYTPLNGTNTLLGMGNVMTPQQIKERFNISVNPAGEVVDTFVISPLLFVKGKLLIVESNTFELELLLTNILSDVDKVPVASLGADKIILSAPKQSTSRDTEPDVPPPLNPSPALTAVISPILVVKNERKQA